MIPLNIRPARLKDWKVILNIESQALNKYYSTGTTKSATTKYLNTETILLAYLKKNFIGKISYYKNNNNVHISGLVIDDKYRGNGYGRILTKYVIELHPLINKFSLTVHPLNMHAKNIYLNMGFKTKKVIDNYYGDGEPRELMDFSRIRLAKK